MRPSASVAANHHSTPCALLPSAPHSEFPLPALPAAGSSVAATTEHAVWTKEKPAKAVLRMDSSLKFSQERW